MSLPKCITHNQGFFTATFIAMVIFLACLSCQMTETQKKESIAAAADSAIAVTTAQPFPWAKIGLILGNILGTGAIIDNRRKDILINLLKKGSHAADTLADQIRSQANSYSTQPGSLRDSGS
jgi:hypothetical protein